MSLDSHHVFGEVPGLNLASFLLDSFLFLCVCVFVICNYLKYELFACRDIKLANILLGVDNHVRICDLGLCKLGMTGKTRTHTRCGALRYCAPEVLCVCLGQGGHVGWGRGGEGETYTQQYVTYRS